MTPLISVIIVTWNSAKWLPRCLESLRAQTIADKIEIVIVDNNSEDECGWFRPNGGLGAERGNIRHFQTGSNRGFVANNIGAQRARGKYLYLLNPDTWLNPFCLESLYERAERSGASIVGSEVMDYETLKPLAYGADGFDLCGEPIESHDDDHRDLLAFAGFCFIRRDWFIHIGQLNDALFMYGEEWDLSWRTWMAGGKIALDPDAVVYHYTRQGSSPCKRFLANRNALFIIACNAQHVLLLLLIPCSIMILAEAFWSGLSRVDWHWLKRAGLEPFADLWRLRLKIMETRYCNRTIRKRSDWFMLRFLRLGWARWPYVKAAFANARQTRRKEQIVKAVFTPLPRNKA